MKNTKTKIIFSAAAILLAIGFSGIVKAAGVFLDVTPASLLKSSGDVFNVYVNINSSGERICAVEGNLVLDNLSCQNISMAGDVMAQSTPTCSRPYFLIGIPNCTTAKKALFTISVKAKDAGTASVGFTGVDLIAEGVSAGSAFMAGNYTIKTMESAPSTTIPGPGIEPVVNPGTPEPTSEIPNGIVAMNPNAFLATVSSAITFGTGDNIIGIIVLSSIGLIIYLAYHYLRGKKKKIK